MKIYDVIRGKGGLVTCVVRNSGYTDNMLEHCAFHSSMFETGYGGARPADLALSILADFCDVSPAEVKRIRESALTLSKQNRSHIPIRLHQLFKADFIADKRRRLEPGESYTITGEEIRKWIETNKGRDR